VRPHSQVTRIDIARAPFAGDRTARGGAGEGDSSNCQIPRGAGIISGAYGEEGSREHGNDEAADDEGAAREGAAREDAAREGAAGESTRGEATEHVKHAAACACPGAGGSEGDRDFEVEREGAGGVEACGD
jgi:hypothetical protein